MGVLRAVLWVTCVTVSLLLIEPRDASACVPPPEGTFARDVVPEDGATDVPRNARILVEYEGDDPQSVLELRVQGGAAVAVSFSAPRNLDFTRVITPDAPLAASTTYELVDTWTAECDCTGEPVVIATFTTGASLDETAPILSAVSVDSGFLCNADSACSDGEDEVHDQIQITGLSDEGPASWLRYEYLDTNGSVIAGPTPLLVAGRGCGTHGNGYFPFFPYVSTPEAFRIRAVDLAGNTSDAVSLTGGSCDVLGADCGVEGGDDDGDGDGDGDGDAEDGGGCSTGPGGGPALAGLLAALLLVSRRRGAR